MTPDDSPYLDYAGVLPQLATIMGRSDNAPKVLVRGGPGTGKTALLRHLSSTLGPGYLVVRVGDLPRGASFEGFYRSVVEQVFPSFMECLAAGPPLSGTREQDVVVNLVDVRRALLAFQDELVKPAPDPRKIDFYRAWFTLGKLALGPCLRAGLSARFQDYGTPCLLAEMLRALSRYSRKVSGVGYVVVVDGMSFGVDHGVHEGLRSLADPTNTEVGLLVGLLDTYPLRNDVLQRLQGSAVSLEPIRDVGVAARLLAHLGESSGVALTPEAADYLARELFKGGPVWFAGQTSPQDAVRLVRSISGAAGDGRPLDVPDVCRVLGTPLPEPG